MSAMTNRSVSTGRRRVALLGWHVPGTGLTRAQRSLFAAMGPSYEFHVAGLGRGEGLVEGDVRIHPVNAEGGDVLGSRATRELVAATEADVLVVHQDLWFFGAYAREFAELRPETRVVAWLPLDGDVVDAEVVRPLAGVDRVVVYTDWARRNLVRAFQVLAADDPSLVFPTVDVIPLAVDGEAFRPLGGPSDRAALKAELFPSLEDPASAFVVLNANRWRERKRLDLTLEGFAAFVRGKPRDVVLCLHDMHAPNLLDVDVTDFLADLGLSGRVILNPLGPRGAPVDDAALNRLYNACDVGLNTAMGEGWGLVSAEHAATGAPQVVPDHSACAEIWRGAAEVVPVARTYVPSFSCFSMGEVSARDVAAGLERVYRDAAHHAGLAAAGRLRSGAVTWATVAGRWRRLLDGGP